MKKCKDQLDYKVFSSDDDINSDDFDSDSDVSSRENEVVFTSSVQSSNKYKTGMYAALGITDEDVHRLKQEESASSGKCQLSSAKTHQKNSCRPPEVIVFDDPSKRHTHKVAQSKHSEGSEVKELIKTAGKSNCSQEVFDFDVARHKVRQFGIKGFEGTKKEDAVLNMLIKLGAKAPKKAYVNYKQLLQEKKQEKEESSQNKKLKNRAFTGSKASASRKNSKQTSKSKPKSKRGGASRVAQSGGVHFVNRKDLQKMKSAAKS